MRRRMKAIIIGAGRGRRLKALTEQNPKCYAEVAGRSILDWTLEALAAAGIRDIVFVGGYLIDKIRADYPSFTFCNNADWANNNILASLFCAEEQMAEGFVCSYSDTLYRGDVVRRAIEHPADIALCVDTDWRSRYVGRTQHPETDAEKVIARGDEVVKVHRDIAPDEATGEYIGVTCFSPRGAAQLREHYHRARAAFAGKPWREAAVFEKAYKILLYQQMLEGGVALHQVTTAGQYIEIDTEQDYEYANRVWKAD
jgi:choline kinase